MRPHRSITKNLNRQALAARRELVHAAGCVEPCCASKWMHHSPEWGYDPELRPDKRVRVPRSLRRFLGNEIGPDNCQRCKGAKGGVLGNENIVNGVVMCDYCTSEVSRASQPIK